MRKINSKFITNFISESGNFLQNKDYFAFVELDKFAIYVIADGIDNDIDLESAKIAVSSIISNFNQNPSMRKGFLKKLLKLANKELIEQSKKLRLKTSITIVVTNYVKVRYALVGNTRFCLFREGFLKHQSKDQSLTQQLVDREKVQLDKIAQHEEKNNLYCFLGQDEKLTPYISKKFKLQKGDVITLLTKGVWENIDSAEMIDGLADAKEAQEVIDNVEEMLLSKQPEALENYTLAVIFVDKIYQNPKRKQKIKNILLTVIPILIIIAIIFFVWYFKHQKRLEQISEMNYAIKNANSYIEDENFIRANEEYKNALNLAKKLKLEDKRADMDQYYKLTETIIDADKSLQDAAYQDALDTYLSAEKKAYYADNLGKDYIDEQLNKTNEHIKVFDLLAQGDKKMELEDLTAAKEDYKLARDLATNIFFKEAKKEANDKLVQIYEADAQEEKEQQEEEKAIEEEEQALAQEEEKEEKEKLSTQLNALEISKKGDVSYSIGSYHDAKMYYTMAQEMYKQIEMYGFADKTEEKIQLTAQKIQEATTKKAKADMYVEDANAEFDKGNLSEAKMLYLFAKDIYEEAKLLDAVKKIDEKIKVIDTLIEKQS
ncbi:PP2C family protein-serine/threonine phosphatase [Marinisporobacter balticus]|uniref:Serine/threonine protein phosphatase PrpC n=1 Tax=Marinisporobacter balticus TaxID=2018667 RepID=A0A4R2KLE6_9FIRM|nr:SpoIIE family protein phosphatase [Marinisporobacter balticus]TCO71506.1 serine/threonine protein phosphatase PrpC [Marinisporobacter balticus]